MDGKAPAAFVEPSEFNEVMKRLDGGVIGLLLFLIYVQISSMFI